MEVDLHAAILIGVDVLAGRSGDRGGLWPVHDRFRGQTLRPERRPGRDADELRVVDRRLLRGREITHIARRMAHFGQQIGVRGVTARGVRQQQESPARVEALAGARAQDAVVAGFFGFHADSGQAIAAVLAGVAARKIENLEPVHQPRFNRGRFLRMQLLRWHFEIVVLQRPVTGAERKIVLKFVDRNDIGS